MSDFDPNHQPKHYLFKAGVKVVVFNQEGQILFLRRSQKCSRAGGWDFPGGALENEQIVEGGLRELEEETGLVIKDAELVSTLVTETDQELVLGLHFGLKAETQSHEIKISWEHDLFEWITPAEALKRELPEAHRQHLEKALES